MPLSLLLQDNVVTANFYEVEPAVNLFLPLLQAPLIKVKAQFLLWQRFCQNHFDVVVWKRAIFSCNKNTTQYSRNTFSIFFYCRTIVFHATTDIIRFTNNYGSTSFGRSVSKMYRPIHNDISISTGATIKKIAATSRKIKL